ncbi:MAG TPA: PilZ domain-containing protein [Candidatus Acidoferrum sp.]|nr:PilZ domain-containing protein [Candidatus Acidoferrum sp.]
MIEERRKSERQDAPQFMTVYDAASKQPVGTLVNMSTEGAMFVTDRPVKPATTFRCRVELPQDIMDHEQVRFEAECRWCRKNVAKDRWESGYRLTAEGIEAYLISCLVLGFTLGDWGDKTLADVKTVDMENRRRAERYEFESQLAAFEPTSYRQIGLVADLSADGVRLITDGPITEGSKFPCRVKLPKKVFQREFLALNLKCRWCRELKNRNQYESGYRFIDISKEDAAIVLHLMIHYGKPRGSQKRIAVVG